MVRETGRSGSPGTIETGTIFVATADSVSTDEGNSFLDSETKTTNEDIQDVILAESAIGKAADRRAIGFRVLVPTATSPFDVRTAHVLDCNAAGQTGMIYTLSQHIYRTGARKSAMFSTYVHRSA